MKAAISMEKLTKRFGRATVLNDLTFVVPEGSIYALLGPNGAGKTTMIKTLVNIYTPNRGKATILNMDSRKLEPEVFRKIGYVSENQELPEWMTVNKFLTYCSSMYPNWSKDFCDDLLKQFGLPGTATIKSLSRGMKMKVALVSSLAYRPQLLILDEPFSGLDPLARQEFINGVLEITENEHWTIFLSSHDIDEVDLLADWVGIIDKGQLKLSEETDTLRARFRRMEVTVADAVSLDHYLVPKSWLLPQVEGRAISFVESQYQEGESEQALKKMFPALTNLHVQSMSLKEIFLIMAKQFKMLNI